MCRRLTFAGRSTAARTSAQRASGRREAGADGRGSLQLGPGERISPRKSEEISLLQSGAGNTTQSTLGVRIGKIRARREAGDTFDGKILDLVVFEASRLMKQFPKLNSAFSENQIFNFSSINAGVAFDNGAKAHCLRHREFELEEFAGDQRRDRRLPRSILERSPFAAGNDEGDLHRDRSVGEPDGFRVAYSPGSAVLHHRRDAQFEIGIFTLCRFRSPDHRRSGSSPFPRPARRKDCVLRPRGAAVAEPPRCFFCETSATDRVNEDKRGLLKIVTASGDEVLCCNTCWMGW